jgi:hypothetical protein
MAKARPKRMPANTRKRLSLRDFRRMPLLRRSYPAASTSEGGGKRTEGKKWLLAMISHRRKKERIEMVVHFKSVLFMEYPLG